MRLRNVSIIIGIFILLIASNRAYDQVRGDEQINIIQLASYQNESSLLGLPVKVKVKILLQGCYDTNTGQMTTLLNTGSHLPLTSPYCEDQRAVSTIPSNITDWVLVQLHNSADGAPVVSHSAFLRHDGYIVADDGTTNILVAVPPGNYYVAVVHRNHTTIMTNSAIALNSDSSVLYDFTSSAEKCYGANGLAELEPGVYGMWAGDINHDGMVTTRDYKIWFESYRVGLSGYQSSDINQDGLVENQDYLVWLENAQKGAVSPITRTGEYSEICLSANYLDFGPVALNGSSNRTFRISNTGTVSLIVSAMNTTNEAFKIIGSTILIIAPGASQNVTILFKPTMASIYLDSLNISNNSDEKAKYIILSGSGSMTGTVMDIDGITYKTIKIGDQWWMAENLKVTRYLNGDEIPYIIGSGPWSILSTGGYCRYGYRDDLAAEFGNLYNWYAIHDSRGVAPAGWHVPTDAEWQTLVEYLGGASLAGNKMKEIGDEHWGYLNTDATNESGFTALAAGLIDQTGIFNALMNTASFWSSTDFQNNAAWRFSLSHSSSFVNRTESFKNEGLSIRCIRTEESANTPPNASFYPIPAFGITNYDFRFDASSCTDAEDSNDSLMVRWDWESDGLWDTDYSTLKAATHLYQLPGIYTIVVEVKDTGGLTNSRTRQVKVVGTGTVSDIDGNIYKTVQIGDKHWMMENLKVTHYRTGESIPDISDYSAWVSTIEGACCIYENDATNLAIYGRLYNWHAVYDVRNIAPEGWHVATDSDWQSLIDYLGGSNIAGGKMKEVGVIHWLSPNAASNESCLYMLPGGKRGNSNGWYYSINTNAYFWTFNVDSSRGPRAWELHNSTTNIANYGYSENCGFSVRCVKD